MSEISVNGYKSGSNLERVVAAGHFAVTGELGPPKSHDADIIRKKAGMLKGIVDAVNITDNQTAIVRMSSIGAGTITVLEGVEPVIQMTCRHRNRLAIQADLLGAAALGMKNVLCLSGDHQTFGNHPFAKNVHDIDSMQLVRMVKDLRTGVETSNVQAVMDGDLDAFVNGWLRAGQPLKRMQGVKDEEE